MSVPSCYSIVEIPPTYQQKLGYNCKLWRALGKNDYSAIMTGLIHFCFIKEQQSKIEMMMSNNKGQTYQSQTFIRTLKECLAQKQNQLQYIFDNLRCTDSSNVNSGLFLQEYLVKQGISNRTNDFESVMNKFSNIVDVQFEVFNKLATSSRFGQKSKELLRFYKGEQQWYYIIEDPPIELSQSYKITNYQSIPKQKCNICFKISEIYFTPICKHYVCLDCIQAKFLVKSITQIKCNSTRCPIIIKRTQFLEFKDNLNSQRSNRDLNGSQTNLDKRPSQTLQPSQKQQYQPSQNEISLIKCYSCQKQKEIDQIFQNKACLHTFCAQCLNNIAKNQIQDYRLCLVSTCAAKLQTKDINLFLKKDDIIPEQSQAQVQPPLQNKEDYQTCNKCLNQYTAESVYVNYCGHCYCKSCSDKEILKLTPNFKCYKSYCREFIDIKDLQKYFYNQIQLQNSKNCHQCKEPNIPSMMFRNTICDHYICFECINKQVIAGRINTRCPAKNCYKLLNQDELELFYERKQEELMNEQQKEIENENQLQKSQQIEQEKLKKTEEQNQKQEGQQQLKSVVQQQQQQQQQQEKQKKQEFEDSQLYQQQQQSQKNAIEIEKQQMELENEQEQQQEQEQIVQGQCTMCNQYFTEFNILLDLDCKIHKIGVCCMIYPVKCPQCDYKPSSSIKIERFILPKKNEDQSFSQSQIYSYQYSRDAEQLQRPNSRLGNQNAFLSQSTQWNPRNASVDPSYGYYSRFQTNKHPVISQYK